VTVKALTAHLGSPAAIFTADDDALRGAPGAAREVVKKLVAQRGAVDPEREEARARKLGARIVTPADADYPAPLRALYDPPLALYVQGTLEARDRHAVALVGSRRATHYGREAAQRLAYLLAQNGLTVVSGLARGIDTAAHQGALKGGGRTLAVLGGALDCFFPPENKALGAEIAGHGAVLSEFALGREPDKTTFPIRNRIVSGLALGVVVVEADLTSGAMITAQQALEQGRAVFAVPGRIDSAMSRGTHSLIKSGARLVEGVEDVLQEFETLLPRRAGTPATDSAPPRPRLTPDEQRLVDAIEADEPQDLDTVIRRSGLGAAAVNALLLTLEMKRAIRLRPGRLVERAR
jgi:DNA processing protein